MNDKFIIANHTDVGRMREVNEDSMVTFDSPNGRVVAVCDGMGGQAAGDVASRLACDIITDILSNNKFATPAEAITRAMVAANQGILHRASQNPELQGMGATCVMVIIKNGLIYYGWVGDSRIYYIENGVIQQVSRDQSYVQQLVDSGQISREEAENHPLKNEITNALGIEAMTPPLVCSMPLDPKPGSIVLLCSDGLSGMVDNMTIAEIACQPNKTLQRRAEELCQKANENGGTDNITLQLIEFPAETAVSANADKDKSKMMVWLSAAAAVLILAFVCLFFFNDKSEKEAVKSEEATVTETVKKTTAKPAESPKPATKVVTKEKVVVEQKTVKKKEIKGKEKKTTPKPWDNAKEKKAPSTPNQINNIGGGGGSSQLEEAMGNK